MLTIIGQLITTQCLHCTWLPQFWTISSALWWYIIRSRHSYISISRILSILCYLSQPWVVSTSIIANTSTLLTSPCEVPSYTGSRVEVLAMMLVLMTHGWER